MSDKAETTNDDASAARTWMSVGFSALGFLVGNLVGLTSHSVVTSLLGLLFAFGGSSILALLSKLSSQDRRVAGQCIFALSLACLLGTYFGILVTEWRLLSPFRPRNLQVTVPGRQSSLDNKYLNITSISKMNQVDFELRQGVIKCEQAYEELRSVVEQAPNATPEPQH